MKYFNILVAGLPGSGKTILIEAIKSHLNEKTNIIDFRDHKLNLIEFKENKDLSDIYEIICLIDYNREKDSKEFCHNIIRIINKRAKIIQVYTKAPFNSYNNDVFYYENSLLGQEIILEKILDEINPTEDLKR